MRLVLLGPPGSGKGTQAKLLAEKVEIPHICLGDILREEVRMGTEIGKEIKEIMNTGKLVPDGVAVGLTRKRIVAEDCKNGFILDGFPRSLAQAEAFDKMLKEINLPLDKVVYFKLDKDQIVERLVGRRSCKKCGAVYQVKLKPPKIEAKCDLCGGELYHRSDDSEATIRTRFEVYDKQTKPLLERYKVAQKLALLEADGKIEEIFARLITLTGHAEN